MGYDINVNVNFGSAISKTDELRKTMEELSAAVTRYGELSYSANSKPNKAIKITADEYKKLKGNLGELAAAQYKHENILRKLTEAEDKNYKAIKAANQELGKATRAYSEATASVERYEKEQQKAIDKNNKLIASTQRTNTAAQSLSKTFNSLGAVLGVSFGAYGAFRVLVGLTKTIADFELANAKLRSILALTSKQMEDITQSAIRVGQGSIFGAKGVTELQIELAKMGFAKTEIISMQEAIVNLATATQEDLASSAEVVANIIRTYSLNASDAARVTDIMGKAFNDSALDLANFREAIKYVSPIAAQANFKFEETVAILEQLSNVGIKGSLAGTGLTNIISRLGDESSKFSKTLGRTVNGFDEFLAAMIELKNKGADLGDTFDLVDRRAAAAFTIILEGVDDIEEFRKKLLDADGVMKQQTAVQLDTLTNKWKLMNEAITSTILSIDKGDGVFSNILKSWIGSVNGLLEAITGVKEEMAKEDMIKALDDSRALGLKVNSQYLKELEEFVKKAKSYQENAVVFDGLNMQQQAEKQRELAQKEWDKYYAYVAKVNALNNAEISDQVNVQVESIRKTLATVGETQYFKDLPLTIARIESVNKTLSEAGKEESALYRINQQVIAAFNKEYEDFQKNKELNTKLNEDSKKSNQERIKDAISLLEIQKKNAEEYIKLQNDGYIESQKLADNDLLFGKKILEKKLELEIVSGTNVVEARKANKLEIENVELKYAAAMQAIAVKMTDDLIKEEERLTKAGEKFSDDVNKNMADNLAEMLKFLAENRKKLEKEAEWKGDNPVWAALGFTSENTDFIDALKKGFDLAKDYITGWADKWVEQTERVVEARNNAVDEAEQALQTEIQLAELGFASNVTLKRKQLEEEKKLREKALADAKKARQVQAQIDTATQVSSLLTAAANIMKGFSTLPLIGQILGVAAIGSMLASFIAFRTKAMAAASTDKFEKGGEVGGRRHSQGGTHIEAEQGEYVVNRRSTLKHKKLIEAINNDDKVSLDKIYLNGLKSSVLSAHVSLDDSQDLKAIRKALEKQGKQVTYFGNYRIEKQGNVTSKILMN